MTGRIPPRYVPTLTEVVDPAAACTPAVQPVTAPGAEAPAAAPPFSEDELVRRVMRRVDARLEQRLREAVAAAVIEQTRALRPILQCEIEGVVRQAVAEAFEAELRRTLRS